MKSTSQSQGGQAACTGWKFNRGGVEGEDQSFMVQDQVQVRLKRGTFICVITGGFGGVRLSISICVQCGDLLKCRDLRHIQHEIKRNRVAAHLQTCIMIDREVTQRMRESRASALPVVSGGLLVGLVTLENVSELLLVRDALRKHTERR